MKKRNKYYLRDKEYIRLKKDLRQNWETQRELGWVELPEPKFIGWIAKLEPRSDIQNREDAWIFWTICQNFCSVSFAKKLDLFEWNAKKKNRYLISIKPHINSISQHTYLSLPSQIQKYFKEDTHSYRWGTWYHCDVPSFYWEIAYEKEYQTRVRLFDEVLQQESSEIKSKIRNKFYKENQVMNNAPKHFRKYLNQKQRTKSKKVLYNIINKNREDEFDDNYKGANWLWW